MSISINYLVDLPMENQYLNKFPLAFLVLGFEFLLIHAITLFRRRKSWDFCKSQHGHSKDFDGEEDQDLELTKSQPCLVEKAVDGSISREETEMVLKNLGLFCQPDEDEKLQERLSCEDLVSLFEENKACLGEFKEAFDVFDENKDGFIDVEELQRILLVLGLKEGIELDNCKRMIGVFDEDKNGRIDFDEFVKLMEGYDC